jgi:hypothetical protein
MATIAFQKSPNTAFVRSPTRIAAYNPPANPIGELGFQPNLS